MSADDFDMVVADVAGFGKREIRIHPPAACVGSPCPFHAPSDHPLRSRPINMRLDRIGLVERICSHGVGHPDPDSVSYLKRVTGETHWEIHGCDGCCGDGA